MNKIAFIICFICLCLVSRAQDEKSVIKDSLTFSGQLSLYGHYNASNHYELWSGGRYLPEVNYQLFLKEDRLLDFEVSGNAYGNLGMKPFSEYTDNGDIKPYRAWMRYSGRQFEVRAGLQKINFGSANLLRPLMWFDQLDPRDPLKLTDGVWGILGRYYFLNNANVWLWGLYGNKNPKGWEAIPANTKIPEFGGRFQTPVPMGEAALSYHHRNVNASDIFTNKFDFDEVPENRIGLDARFDMVVGWWIEASLVHKGKDMGILTNQEIINLGLDYTFGIGNGISMVYEQLIASSDEKYLGFDNTITYSLCNVSYPIGLFDNINAIVYYDWNNNSVYNFVNWQKQFSRMSLFIMAYANPKNYNIPTQETDQVLYAGNGIQLMLVFNH